MVLDDGIGSMGLVSMILSVHNIALIVSQCQRHILVLSMLLNSV